MITVFGVLKKLILSFTSISDVLVTRDLQAKLWSTSRRIVCCCFFLLFFFYSNSTEVYNVNLFRCELRWIKTLQTSFPLGFIDDIYHMGNVSKMPDFYVSLLGGCKRNERSNG